MIKTEMKFTKCLKTEGQVSAGLKAEQLNSYGHAFCITFVKRLQSTMHSVLHELTNEELRMIDDLRTVIPALQTVNDGCIASFDYSKLHQLYVNN
ncbi:unnamed protein product [Wuchereria bancrofti]|uniref:Uncharacterized protein n=1 Tax=Wuchereria bancrofti TaxID=6293 RepID=A0A3P7F093_WUCBA|nr:unnamed protein product [Wuchereria bancrofti]